MRLLSSTWLLLIFFMTISSPSTAQQQWNVGGSGDWFTAFNWSPSGVPNAALDALINNGGEAVANGALVEALSVSAGKNGGNGDVRSMNANVSIQTSLDIGDIEGTFATGGANVTSNGNAVFADGTLAQFGLAGLGDINAGQTSASGGATANGTGSVTFQRFATITAPGDLDVGQTSGDATATGMGTALIEDITNTLNVGGDIDIGQTSATSGGMNAGTGFATLQRIANLQVGADFDVGQSTGDGSANGIGNVLVEDVTQLTIGDSLDIAKVRSFQTGNNIGNGVMEMRDLDASIGFAAANPGSIEIARVLTSESALGRGVGRLTIEQSDVLVANDVIVGELALGGTNANSSADAELTLIDSRIDTRDLFVANRLDGTAGSIQGEFRLERSLAIVQSVLDLGDNATLQMQIDGTTRALGDGLATDYSAIDADNATLDGIMRVVTSSAYLGPTQRGDTDDFLLIATLFGLAGTFDNVSFDGTVLGSGRTYVGATNDGDDGLFAEVDQNANDLVVSAYLAIPGDANGDGFTDGQDFIIWNDNKFAGGKDWSTADFNGDGVTDGQDFIIWNDNKFTSAPGPTLVPEPTAVWLLLAAGVMVLGARRKETVLARVGPHR